MHTYINRKRIYANEHIHQNETKELFNVNVITPAEAYVPEGIPSLTSSPSLYSTTPCGLASAFDNFFLIIWEKFKSILK